MSEIEEQGIEIEAPTTFSGAALADQDIVQGYDEEDAEQLDEESMNDESVNNETSYTNAGYSYVTSNIKWFVIAMASFAVFLGIGLAGGFGIGNKIYGNDNGASSVSSAMDVVDYTTSENGGKSGNSEGPSGSKSAKSAGSKSGKGLKESEKCVSKPSKEKNAGCKASPPQYDDYIMGRMARGTLSRYYIPSTDNCPVEINLMPGGPCRNLRQLEPSSQVCFDVDFRRFEIKESDIVNTLCGDPFSVEFTAGSYDLGTKPTMIPVLFSDIYGADCAGLKVEAPDNGAGGLEPMGANAWGYTMNLKAGWYTVAMFAVVPGIPGSSIPEADVVGECRGDESEYTFRMSKGELPPVMNVEEVSDVSLLQLIDGILFTYDIIPEDGFN